MVLPYPLGGFIPQLDLWYYHTHWVGSSHSWTYGTTIPTGWVHPIACLDVVVNRNLKHPVRCYSLEVL